MKKGNWHGGKGSGRRNTQNDSSYSDNYDKIFGKIKTRKVIPDHGSTKTHSDKSKYNRKSQSEIMQDELEPIHYEGDD